MKAVISTHTWAMLTTAWKNRWPWINQSVPNQSIHGHLRTFELESKIKWPITFYLICDRCRFFKILSYLSNKVELTSMKSSIKLYVTSIHLPAKKAMHILEWLKYNQQNIYNIKERPTNLWCFAKKSITIVHAGVQLIMSKPNRRWPTL